MKRPGLLNTDSAGFFADGKGGAVSAALDLQDNALENLNTLAVAFLNAVVNTNGIAGIDDIPG